MEQVRSYYNKKPARLVC